ncbi:hypothetical protein [Rubritalea sp.]|uniref:hypothetical protein n=1 Tax=Rubritalea sp. TaxID=2109375 RepID=UPI0032426845
MTLGNDNGLEFAGHVRLCQEREAAGYFCASYPSWEKGGVEKLSGQVRQYYSKSSSFATTTGKDLKFVESELNGRPRKILEALSPAVLNQRIAA